MESLILPNDITQLLDFGNDMFERVGDCANMEHKVNTKNILWKTVDVYKGWTLQKEHLTKKARIVDDKGIRRGNGSLTAMKEKRERLLSKDFLRPGDVIGVSRGAYEHYGIYVGDKRVIHYAGVGNDFKGEITIHEAPFSEFIKNGKSYFVLSFEGKYPVKIQSTTKFIANSIYTRYNKIYDVCSAQETLKRAYSRIGEAKYSLIKNNCEHFAMWCKTGISESTQVKQIISYVLGTGISLTSFAESKGDIVSYLSI